MQADGELGEVVIIMDEKGKKYSSKKQSDINNFSRGMKMERRLAKI